MEKTVSAEDAPVRFADLLHEVTDQGDRYVVEDNGVPLAAVIPFALYSQWKRRRERFFEEMRQVAERVGLDDDEAMRIAEDVKRSVRSRS